MLAVFLRLIGANNKLFHSNVLGDTAASGRGAGVGVAHCFGEQIGILKKLAVDQYPRNIYVDRQDSKTGYIRLQLHIHPSYSRG